MVLPGAIAPYRLRLAGNGIRFVNVPGGRIRQRAADGYRLYDALAKDTTEETLEKKKMRTDYSIKSEKKEREIRLINLMNPSVS